MKAVIGEPHNNLNAWFLSMQDTKNRAGTKLKLTKMQEILF